MSIVCMDGHWLVSVTHVHFAKKTLRYRPCSETRRYKNQPISMVEFYWQSDIWFYGFHYYSWPSIWRSIFWTLNSMSLVGKHGNTMLIRNNSNSNWIKYYKYIIEYWKQLIKYAMTKLKINETKDTQHCFNPIIHFVEWVPFARWNELRHPGAQKTSHC